jgi:hypothetical protein
MKQTIAIKIDVTKIDKTKLYKGEKGTYLDAVLMYNSEADQYGQNGMIVQSVTKEEREAGVKGAILGNGKVVWSEGATQAPGAQAQAAAYAPTASVPDVTDDIPF